MAEEERRSTVGFDVTRILAMVAIVYQHLWPIHDLPTYQRGVLSFGQMGVAVFCGLSGFFASGSSRDGNLLWLGRRLTKILPAYWIALTSVFIINALAAYKPTSLAAIVLQYAGLAAVLAPEQRIGQAYWFVTLILTCYTVALLLRRWPWSTAIIVIIAITLLRYNLWFPIHVISFTFGSVASRRRVPIVQALLLLAPLTLAVFYHSVYWYPTVAMLALILAGSFQWTSPRWLSNIARGTYEFFLIHGAVYLGLARIAGLNLIQNATAGTLLCGLGASVLARVSRRLTELVPIFNHPAVPPSS